MTYLKDFTKKTGIDEDMLSRIIIASLLMAIVIKLMLL